MFINIEISQYTLGVFWFVNLWSFFLVRRRHLKKQKIARKHIHVMTLGVCVICGLVALVTLGFCYEGYRLNSPCGRPYWNSNGQVDRKGRPYWNCCMLCWMMTWSSASMLQTYWNWDVQLLPKKNGVRNGFSQENSWELHLQWCHRFARKRKVGNLETLKPWHFYSFCEARCAFCVPLSSWNICRHSGMGDSFHSDCVSFRVLDPNIQVT